MNCKDCSVIESLNKAWSALCEQYDNSPDEEIRIAVNLLAKVIRKVKSDFIELQKENEPHQITIEEWLSFFNTD